jgi:hypothetical protein
MSRIYLLTLVFLFSLSAKGYAQFDRGGAMNNEESHRHSLLAEMPLRTWSTHDKDFNLGLTYRYSISGEKFLGIFGTFYARPYGKSVLIEIRPHFYYQVKEYRYILAAGLDKKFWLSSQWDLFLHAGLGYSFADHSGTASADTKNGITPVVNGGVSYKFNRYIFFRAGYEVVDIRTVKGNRLYFAIGGQI